MQDRAALALELKLDSAWKAIDRGHWSVAKDGCEQLVGCLDALFHLHEIDTEEWSDLRDVAVGWSIYSEYRAFERRTGVKLDVV